MHFSLADERLTACVHALEQLDHIRAFAHARTNELAYVGDASRFVSRRVKVIRQERLAGDEHARPLHVAALDRIAQA
jgi:hypothetical protein